MAWYTAPAELGGLIDKVQAGATSGLKQSQLEATREWNDLQEKAAEASNRTNWGSMLGGLAALALPPASPLVAGLLSAGATGLGGLLGRSMGPGLSGGEYWQTKRGEFSDTMTEGLLKSMALSGMSAAMMAKYKGVPEAPTPEPLAPSQPAWPRPGLIYPVAEPNEMWRRLL